MERADIQATVACHLTFLEEVAEPGDAAYGAALTAYMEEHLEDGSLACYIALEGARVVAKNTLCLYTVAPKWNNPSGRIGYIYGVYTDPAYRGRGLATRLMEMALEAVKAWGAGEVYLNAQPVAERLYARLGFVPVVREMKLRF